MAQYGTDKNCVYVINRIFQITLIKFVTPNGFLS